MTYSGFEHKLFVQYTRLKSLFVCPASSVHINDLLSGGCKKSELLPGVELQQDSSQLPTGQHCVLHPQLLFQLEARENFSWYNADMGLAGMARAWLPVTAQQAESHEASSTLEVFPAQVIHQLQVRAQQTGIHSSCRPGQKK